MTKGELARYIKDLECKYSEFMATKFANGLSLGHCNLECLEQKAFLAKETIKVLQRFYNEGKLCPAEDCTIVGKTFLIYKACGSDPLGVTVELPETYICYYTYVNDSTLARLVGTYGTYSSNNTLSGVTPSGGSYGPLAYTYDADTKILIIPSLGGGVSLQLSYSDDCSEITMTATLDGVNYELYATLVNNTTSTDDCDWQEYCITEEEALDMYKKTKQILGVKCNCN